MLQRLVYVNWGSKIHLQSICKALSPDKKIFITMVLPYILALCLQDHVFMK